MSRPSTIRAAAILTLASALAFVSHTQAATYVVPPDDVLVGKAHAVVVARALHSYVEESKEHGIQTVTVFAVEERLKDDGALESLEVRLPGGVIEAEDGSRRIKVVPGAPHFVDGEQVLLFVTRSRSGHYAPTDFGLGAFKFATDDLGNRVLIRNETEIHGWTLDGKVHREPRREATRFLQYVRDVAGRRLVQKNYTIDPRPLVGEEAPATPARKLRQAATVCNGCTVTQYTLTAPGFENDPGLRWKTFPRNWNRGSAAANAPNSGSDAINTGFASWASGSSVGYLLVSTNANSNGILDAPDTVNNVLFEDDLSAFGTYTCGGGGVLGLGGVQTSTGDSAAGDSTNIVSGEQFFSSTEADVSMNQGVTGCIGTGLALGDFNSAVMHEIGHTLGLRHTNQSRDGGSPCTNFPAYDCDNAAIMTAVVTNGLNAVKAAWDLRAVAALYPATTLAAPTNVVATANTTTSVGISWNMVSGATTYEVHRSASNNFNNFTIIPACSGAATACTDNSADPGAAYLYRVRAGTAGAFSTPDLATTVLFTDPTIVVGTTTAKAAHVIELRTAVNAVLNLAMQATPPYTDNVLSAGVAIKAAHISEMRTRLANARATLGLSAIPFTDGTLTPAVTPIRAAHINDLRGGVR